MECINTRQREAGKVEKDVCLSCGGIIGNDEQKHDSDKADNDDD